MYYFMSDIHGADKAYFEMKEVINFSTNDELWILGDIFDGFNRRPKACLNMLDDVMSNENIHLLLGNHEFVHMMRDYWMHSEESGANEEFDFWDKSLRDPIFQGTPLLKYFDEHVSTEDRQMYMDYLSKCNITEFLNIAGQNYYLVHGTPVLYTVESEGEWQNNILWDRVNLTHDYTKEIQSDPGYAEFIQQHFQYKDVPFTILSGHTPTKYYYNNYPKLLLHTYGANAFYCDKQEGIIDIDNKIILDCGCRGNSLGKAYDGWASSLACLGIDEHGLSLHYLPILPSKE